MNEIILLGASDKKRGLFEYVVLQLKKKNYEIVAIVDNDINKHGLLVEGHTVISVEEGVQKYPNAFIIICTIKEYPLLTHQMLNLKGITNNKYEYAFRLSEIFNPNVFSYYKNVLSKEGKVYPTQLRLEMSSYCNLKCVYCRYHSSYMSELPTGCNANLDFDLFKDIITQVNEIGTIQKILNVQKGEMFCNPKWYDMLKYILEKTNIRKFHFSTNGMFLTNENIDKLSTLQFEELSVTVSIDGYSEEENEKIREGADFSIIIKNLNYLIEKNIHNIKIQMQNTQILSKEDMNRYKKNIKLVVDDNHYLKKTFRDKIMIERYAALITNNSEIDYIICKRNNASIEYMEYEKSEGCPLPLKEIAIDSEGFVCMCGCEPIGQLYRVENVKEQRMLDIWNNEMFQSIRKQYMDGKRVTICQNCISNAISTKTGVFVKK